MAGGLTRALFLVPIIHTQADLGSLSESVRALHVRKGGRGKWENHIATVNELWKRIHDEVERLRLDYKKVRLYQDGLPSCGHELEIVRDLAEAGSQNHGFLLELMDKGAQLVGTESPEYLIEEYHLVRLMMEQFQSDEKGRLSKGQAERSTAILKKRDRYIAEKISHTLKDGETGLLFLGMLHSLEGLLPRDIRLTTLSQVAWAAGEQTKTGPTGAEED